MYLKDWRLHAGIPTQSDLAALSGVRQGHIAALEAGQHPSPTCDLLCRLRDGLNQRLAVPITVEDRFCPPPAPAPPAATPEVAPC